MHINSTCSLGFCSKFCLPELIDYLEKAPQSVVLHSARSAYMNFFQGMHSFRPYHRIWRSWAPGKCRFFMWLVAHGRCWMADRLARRGFPHPEMCPHCDQAEESINHLLLSCVFARNFLFSVFQRVGLQILAPQIGEEFFDDWWEKIILAAGGQLQKGLNSFVILGAWTIWNHRNRCVFDGVPLVWLEPYFLPARKFSCGVWLGLKVFFTFSPSCLRSVCSLGCGCILFFSWCKGDL